MLSPLSFGESNVKSRIHNVLNYKQPKFWLALLIAVAILIVAALLLSNPRQVNNEVTPDQILQGHNLESLGLSIDLSALTPFKDPNRPEGQEYLYGNAYDVYYVDEEGLNHLSNDVDFGNISALTMNYSWTGIDVDSMPALYFQGFEKDSEHDDLFITVEGELYNISELNQYKLYEDNKYVVFEISDLLSFDFNALIEWYAQEINHYDFDWLTENYRYLKSYEDIRIIQGIPEPEPINRNANRSNYEEIDGEIAEFLEYNFRHRSMYIANLKVIEEFGTANEGSVFIITDQNVLTFDITKATGSVTGVVDGPDVYFKMDLATYSIIDKGFEPAPNYVELGMEEFAEHSEVVIELTDERMVEIGKFFAELIAEIEAN